MAGIVKRVIQTGVILGLVGGVATAAMVGIAGAPRTAALFSQARTAVTNRIDKNITDPVALRAQLRDLEAQYPARIREVRGDLAELREQMAQLNRELTISQRVVSIADRDHDALASALTRASEARVQNVSFDGRGVEPEFVIVFNNERMSVDSARTRLDHVVATRNAYAARAADMTKHMGYLKQQEARLAGLLDKLETERAQFQAQLWDLDRQVDAIARNDRMIDIMQKRQDSIDEQSRYRSASLDQLQAKLAELRAEQESRLETLAGDQTRTNYEEQAKLELDRETGARELRTERIEPAPVRRVIEITPETPAAPETPGDSTVGGRMANSNR